MAKGKTAGSVSFVTVQVSDLLKLRAGAQVLVSRRYAEEVGLAGVANPVTSKALSEAIASTREPQAAKEPQAEKTGAVPVNTDTPVIAPQLSVE